MIRLADRFAEGAHSTSSDESDPKGEKYFDLLTQRAEGLTTYVMDGRVFLKLTSKKYDLIRSMVNVVMKYAELEGMPQSYFAFDRIKSNETCLQTF